MKIVTAGESHGKGLFAIIEGLPAHLKIDFAEIDRMLALRQGGIGRGARQKIECDRAEFLSGVRGGETLGSPVTIAVFNRDYANWEAYMAPQECDTQSRRVTCVRPGHADLAGMKKYAQEDARNVLERASARETAVRVAAGTVCRQLLRALGVHVTGYVRALAGVTDETEYSFAEIARERRSDTGMVSPKSSEQAALRIERLRQEGDTCGGVIELRAAGLKSGFGSCMTYREKLDARLCAALMSVQAIKGVEVGIGFGAAARRGSEVHDEIFAEAGRIFRNTNRAGGIEGGMSNGEEIVLRAAMKPIPTLMRGLRTVDLSTGLPAAAATERSDVCAVAACEVILESVLCSALAEAVLERLGGDTMAELIARYGRLPV